MSLDLPPLPITPKDSEFLQRRPDLFYPYLPAPFLNGVQQKVSDQEQILEKCWSSRETLNRTCRTGALMRMEGRHCSRAKLVVGL